MQSTEQILASTPGSSQLPTSTQTPSRVLVVEPHPTLRTVLVQRLRQDGHLAAAVGTASEAIHALALKKETPNWIMDNPTKDKIQNLIDANPVMVFMKGTKLMPQCGFSNNVVQILNSLGVEFGTFDVLADYEVREGIKEYSDWPTIPQVYLKGEFLGGSDILIEMYNSGSLKEKIEIELAS